MSSLCTVGSVRCADLATGESVVTASVEVPTLATATLAAGVPVGGTGVCIVQVTPYLGFVSVTRSYRTIRAEAP